MRIFEYSTNCYTITIPFLFFYRYNVKLEYKGRQNKRFISIFVEHFLLFYSANRQLFYFCNISILTIPNLEDIHL